MREGELLAGRTVHHLGSNRVNVMALTIAVKKSVA